MLQLIKLCRDLLDQVREVPPLRPSQNRLNSWLFNRFHTEVFKSGIEAVEWSIDDRGLAGLSDLHGLPWRLSMEEFFEAWVETVVGRLARNCGGQLSSGRKRQTITPLSWAPPYSGSQRYLLPDLVLERGDETIIFDAKADDRFRGRIRQHYGSRSTLSGNKNASVFRKHLGGALLRKVDPFDVRLAEWIRQGGRRYLEVEVMVSEYLRANFTYCCFDVASMAERLLLEKGIIAQLAKYPLGRPADGWLGQHAFDDKIRRSGLWNTQQLDAEPLDYQQLDYLRRFTCEGC